MFRYISCLLSLNKNIYHLKKKISFVFEMGRRYYCDYCDKSLPPGLNHRKNHDQGMQHINNKRAYYLQFKGFNDLLEYLWGKMNYCI
jgi:RNase P subunit RPR2